MALDQEYFDSIHIDVVKKKYYNANKVEAVFADIRRQAQELTEENARLREQLQGVGDRKAELGEAVFSAQELYRDIIDKANRRAAAIVAEAEQKRLAIDGENQRQQDYSVQKVEQCFDRVRRQQQAAMDTLNAAWQDFLCGLYPEESLSPSEPDPDMPEDLREKVDAIARELFALER